VHTKSQRRATYRAVQAADTATGKDNEALASRRRPKRGAGLAVRRAAALISQLEDVFHSLSLIGSHGTFSGSVMIFLGTSLSKPREAIEIVFPQAAALECCGGGTCCGLRSVCVQATRQLMPITSQMPAPAARKAKMFVAVITNCALPSAQFDTVADHHCSLTKCLAAVVHVSVGTSQNATAASWLMQHADCTGQNKEQNRCNERETLPAKLQVCSTVVSGLTCGCGMVT
jgi:hypothetical protein